MAWKTDEGPFVLFHQDNCILHTSLMVAMAAVHDCGFELVDHPPYSPAIWHASDYFLFSNMKNHLAGKLGIQALQHGWKKCVDHRGNYVAKINHIWSNLTTAS